MTDIQIDAGTLTANADDRTVTGLLVPFGEQCRSNLGRFSVDTGAFSLPADPSVVGFNRAHAREDPIGRATTVRETPEGVVATFSIARTPEGDTALADISAGRAKFLSAEVANVVIKAGRAIGGRLFGGALVTEPAFPSATLLAAAADTVVDPEANADPAKPTTTVEKAVDEYTDEQGIKHTRTTTTTTVIDGDTTTITTTTEITDPVTPDNTEEPTVPAATPPNTLEASRSGAKRQPTRHQFMTLLAAVANGRANEADLAAFSENAGPSERTLFAALSDIKYDGDGGVTTGISNPQWIGEVWDGNAYRQKFLPLFNHADLTALKFQGYKWDVKPAGGTWAGNKAQIPSNTPKFKTVEGTASRFAGGHDIARELQDLAFFGDTSFFDMYFSAMSESYSQWADEEIVLAEILAGATTVEADNPAGLSIGAGLSAIIDGAAEVIAANATPTFALVALDLWKSIAKLPSDSTLGYLNASLRLTGEEGQLDTFVIQPTDQLAAGEVLVGAREAATVYELPGVPIRANALNIAQGGIDEGVFGYAGAMVNKADALQLVTPYTA